MASFDKYTDVSFLLAKAVQGGLTVEERQALDAWRFENEANDVLYRRVLELSFVKDKLEQREALDMVAAYLKMKKRCVANSRRRVLRRLSTVAAVLLLGIGRGVLVYVTGCGGAGEGDGCRAYPAGRG